MKKRLIFTLVFLCISTLLLASCSKPKVAKENTKVTASTKPSEDRAGNAIQIPDTINRIVSMSPATTELLVTLGLADKLVAVDTFSIELDGVPADLPTFDIMQPDSESLIAMEPDIIFASSLGVKNGDVPLGTVTEFGICTAYLPDSGSLESIKEDILFIGKVVDKEKDVNDLITKMDAQIAEIKKIGDSITDKKSVYFEISNTPSLYSFGSGVFLNEMLNIIGATNIFAEENAWISVSDESVIRFNPDVILTNNDYLENGLDSIKSRNGWDVITAVQNDQVYKIDANASSLPNHNIVKAFKEMALCVYPEEYKELS